jgi:hypothetical protein
VRKIRRDTIEKNVRRVIDDIGGRSTTAAHFNIRPWAVSKWYDSGSIPRGRLKEVCRLANEKLGEDKWTIELLVEG